VAYAGDVDTFEKCLRFHGTYKRMQCLVATVKLKE